VLLCGPTADGGGVAVLRAREGRVEVGEVRPLREGKPLGDGEIVRLRPRDGEASVCDVEVVTALSGLRRAGERDEGVRRARERDEGVRELDEAHAKPRAAAPREGARASSGPACVATNAYRDGWSRIFATGADLN
jgi:hypothetical protein